MSMTRLLRAAAVAHLLLSAIAPSTAACHRSGGFAIYQCGDRGYFEAPPEGSGAVSALFWQIGFGNDLINNGDGIGGAGIDRSGAFSGNDNGLFEVPLVDARAALGDARVPQGALCLGPANWANSGFDGCCDNARDPNILIGMDGLLNPTFNPRALAMGRGFIPAPGRVQDYPMAVLLREATARYFAVAAVASMPRTGLDDVRQGHFSFGDVTEGGANVLSGALNVIPWQKAPELHLEVEEQGAGPLWRVKASWEPVQLPGDASHRPSTAYGIDNPGQGVGVADMGPLVAYEVQKVHLTPSLLSAQGYPILEAFSWALLVATERSGAEVDLAEDDCLRAVARMGKRPRTTAVSVAECRLGHCGDLGFVVPGPPLCLEGPLLREAAQRARKGG